MLRKHLGATPLRKHFFLALCMILFLLPSPPVVQGQPQTAIPPLQLNMAIPYNEQHPVQTGVFLPWAENIRRQSRGTIQISVFDARSLLMEVDPMASLVTGSLGLSCILPSSIFPTPPVSNLLNLYLDAPNARTASRMIWDFLQIYPPLQTELQLIHVLWAWSSSPVYIHSANKAIRSLDDMRGLKWLVWSDIMEDFITAAGGIALRCLPAESAQLLRNGMADGILCPLPPLLSFNISPYIRFTTDYPLIFLSFYMGMNKEIWNALPPTSQKLFADTAGRDMSFRCGLALDQAEDKIRTKMHEKGHTFVPANVQFQQSCQERIAPIRQARFTNTQSLNIPNMYDFRPLLYKIRNDIQREDAQQSP